MKTRNQKRMYLLAFIFSLHIAISAYVNSTFLTNILEPRYIGLIYTISSILTLFSLSNSGFVLDKIGNRNFIFILLFLNMGSLAGIITSIEPIIIALSFVVFLTTNMLVLFSIDIFIEHFSDIDKIELSPQVSLHDFDLGLNLKLMKKLGKIQKATIIGIPPKIGENGAIGELNSIIPSLLSENEKHS